MVRHTEEFLRSRSSNISLRSASLQSTQPQRVASQAQTPTVPKRQTDRIAETPSSNGAGGSMATGDGRSREEPSIICEACLARRDSKQSLAFPTTFSSACRLCFFLAGIMPGAVKPEAFTLPFCDFLTENPTVFHAVDYFKRTTRLIGYEELSARDNWVGKIKPGGKYVVTRNGSSLIAFDVGEAYKPGNGFAMIAAHIDALTARLKPVSAKPTAAGYFQLGVSAYAGALNETWWDRDLSIGGRVIVRDPESGKTKTQLVKVDWPIARIPTLAPHFGIGMMGQKNKETQMVPIIGLDDGKSDSAASKSTSAQENVAKPANSFTATQPPKLVNLIASQLGIKDHTDIVNWELELYDSQPATVGGLDREFIFGGRIDDKLCGWPALMALLLSKHSAKDGHIKLVALFDDEEIGSLLRQGAKSNFLTITLERVVEALCAKAAATAAPAAATVPAVFGPGVMGQTLASSFLLSADVTHAVHPNFQSTYEPQHAPRLNVGVALVTDSNGHMTTDSVSTALLERVAELASARLDHLGRTRPGRNGGDGDGDGDGDGKKKHDNSVVLQRFMIRNDSRSGGTVGPSLSSALGVRAADCGLPQLSMHSIRAMTGALDPGLGVRFFKGFFEEFENADKEWT